MTHRPPDDAQRVDRTGSSTSGAAGDVAPSTDASQGASGGPDRPIDDAATVELLVRYDDASPEDLARLEQDPISAEILGRLRAVDRWLEQAGAGSRGAAGRPETDTVTAEELYAFAKPEDGAGLSDARREEIEAHLESHAEERSWVRSLLEDPPVPRKTGIPSPLEWDSTDHESSRSDQRFSDEATAEELESQTVQLASVSALRAVEDAGERRRRGPFPAWVAWTPLAAAALVLAMALGGGARRTLFNGGLPDSPVLRSARTMSLLFPRGRVVEPRADMASFLSSPLFEVTPVDGASGYRFEVRRGTDSAFDEGEIVWRADSDASTVAASPLPAGAYAWSAWAVVDGLEQPLGTQYVTVVPHAKIPRTLLDHAQAGDSSTSEASVRAAVRELHAAGFVTDARFRARELPPSTERDAYLGID